MTLLAIRAFLGRVPRAVWIALAVTLVLWLGTRWYHGQIKDAERRGADQAYAAIAKKARALEAKANVIADKIRSKSDETARAIAADADVIRVSGPGKARCSAVPAPARGHEATSGQSSPAVDQVPDGRGIDLIALPFAPTIGLGEVCDLNRGEVLAWREWYEKVAAQR